MLFLNIKIRVYWKIGGIDTHYQKIDGPCRFICFYFFKIPGRNSFFNELFKCFYRVPVKICHNLSNISVAYTLRKKNQTEFIKIFVLLKDLSCFFNQCSKTLFGRILIVHIWLHFIKIFSHPVVEKVKKKLFFRTKIVIHPAFANFCFYCNTFHRGIVIICFIETLEGCFKNLFNPFLFI